MERGEVERLLADHNDAWNSHDIDAMTALFDADCVFEASAGPETAGRTFTGIDNVRAAFADVLAAMPDAQWGGGRHYAITGDYGVSEWRLQGTFSDGSRLDVNGCDFLTFGADGKIVRKNSYRKQRPPLPPEPDA
jgi:ketosteroid isomerase-like protein